MRLKCSLILLGFLMGACQSSPQNELEPVLEKKEDLPLILFLGDSLTAGYGLDPSQAYPALVKLKLQEKDYPYSVYNAGVSGDTTSDGLNRLEWHLEQKPAILVLALGANDALRGLNPDVTKKNLKSIIDKAKANDPSIKILLSGMKAPPNMGPAYVAQFNPIYKSLQNEYKLPFVPFLLEGVAAQKDLNLADGIHPNEKGQKIIAQNVWKVLERLL